MNTTAQTPDAAPAVDAVPPGSVNTDVPCVNTESVVMEASADQSWTDLCRGLRRPALLLGDVDEEPSEQA